MALGFTPYLAVYVLRSIFSKELCKDMIRLLVNTYKSDSQARATELYKCFLFNKELTFLTIHDIQPRPTYNDYFKVICHKIGKGYFSNDDIFLIANSDIYFDETLLLANQIKHGEVYALTRYDIKRGQARFFDRPDSQDVWIFRGGINPIEGADFHLGVGGCDNRIAYLLNKAGYKVTNPSLSIKTYHLHESGIRTFDYKKHKVVPPPYLTLKPISL